MSGGCNRSSKKAELSSCPATSAALRQPPPSQPQRDLHLFSRVFVSPCPATQVTLRAPEGESVLEVHPRT